MASKGQKFKNYDNSVNIKDAILEEYKLKRNIKELAERYNASANIMFEGLRLYMNELCRHAKLQKIILNKN